MDRYKQVRDRMDALAEIMAEHNLPKVYLAVEHVGISERHAYRLWRLICDELGDQAR